MGATAAIASVRVGQTRRGPFSGDCARRAVPDGNGTTFALFRPGFFAMVYPCSMIGACAWVTGPLRQVVITVAAAPPTSPAKRLTPTRMANCSRALRCIAMPADALRMALWRRQPPRGQLLHHSQPGVQYASRVFRGLLQAYGMTGSMIRKGGC
ncbi:hypothetical protein [Methylocaldum sp. GT1TLB]|uniref:hypothetical protein n=1 Tax=Methylocaldum sp. GT1TLB TaxID=3438965 RepID=UPI003D9FC861